MVETHDSQYKVSDTPSSSTLGLSSLRAVPASISEVDPVPATPTRDTLQAGRLTLPKTPVSELRDQGLTPFPSSRDVLSTPAKQCSPTKPSPKKKVCLSKKGENPPVKLASSSTATHEQFETPELSRNSILTYAKPGKWSEQDGAEPLRQIKAVRDGTFEEEFVLMGVRFVVG